MVMGGSPPCPRATVLRHVKWIDGPQSHGCKPLLTSHITPETEELPLPENAGKRKRDVNSAIRSPDEWPERQCHREWRSECRGM